MFSAIEASWDFEHVTLYRHVVLSLNVPKLSSSLSLQLTIHYYPSIQFEVM
jgi:hypothetical protein